MHHAALTAIAAAVVLGVLGQMLSSLTRLPAIVFLLFLGVLAGPYALHLVAPAHLGEGLPVLVKVFVAIILFEGALTLRPEVLRQAMAPVRRLITVGMVVSLVGAALLAHFLVSMPWRLAFLYASLVVVTGPTVIAPIIRRIRLLPRLRAVLQSESILIDPVGVFTAVLIHEFVMALATHEADGVGIVLGFAARIGLGVAVGGVAGLLGVLVARLPIFHRRDSEHLVNLGALGLALGAFALAEHWQSESGVMAVIVTGLILSAMPIPFRDELERFKEQMTTLGVSVLFILLAANLNLSLLGKAGWSEVGLLAGLIFLVRPAAVFLSTIRTGMTWREKAFLSLIAPRGILAAAMASYFASQMRARSVPGADQVEMLVFFTIGTTVCLQGSWAAVLAQVLRVRPAKPEGFLLVGVNELSLLLAHELRSWGRPVLLADVNPANCDLAREQGLTALTADATSPETYDNVDLSSVAMMVAMTPNDAVNTLACDAAGVWLGEKRVFQIVGKPVGETPRSEVRMGGRWAMPSRWTQAEVVEAIRQGKLRLDTEAIEKPAVIAAGLPTSHGVMLPLLVMSAGRLSIAVEGQACPPYSIVIGLVGSEARSGVTLPMTAVKPPVGALAPSA